MPIYVFGNPEVDVDSLPVRILPELRHRLPQVEFIHMDPNESWEPADGDLILDTVVGLEKPRLITDFTAFVGGPTLSMHDYDLFADLHLRQKIGKLPHLAYIGLPPGLNLAEATEAVIDLIRNQRT